MPMRTYIGIYSRCGVRGPLSLNTYGPIETVKTTFTAIFRHYEV